jgi:hypothetical protein
MDKSVKNKISHRSQSLALLAKYFADHPDILLDTEATDESKL